MTPEDILNIFIEEHRICSPLDPEADPSLELTMNTTIDDWTNARDLISWRPLSRFLNAEFHMTNTEKEWQSILNPSDEKTLYDVCTFISKNSQHQEIKPVKLLGQECLTAAVFLTLKKNLQRRYLNVRDLKPSTNITPYLEKYFSPMLEQISIISKGGQVFDDIKVKRKKKGILNYINIFDQNRYTFITTDIKTFRDLTLKIIEVNHSLSSH